MPETTRPLKVFLCHASVDKPKVRELYRYLRRRGVNPWFDEEHLIGGQDWQVEIPKALATSDAIIICLTKNSVDKEGYIQKEIKFALDKALEMPEGRIFLIPVKFEECEVPFTLSRYQWVDLTIEAGYSKMMKALKFRASQLERSTVDLSKKTVEEEYLAIEKAAKEKAEREAVEKVAREKSEQEAAEKVAREKAEHEAAEKAKFEKIDREAAEKAAQEKRRQELEREVKKVVKESTHRSQKKERQFKWKIFFSDVRYKLNLILIDIRFYFLPILLGVGAIALLVYVFFYIPQNSPVQNPTPTSDFILAPQPTLTSTEAFIPTEIFTPSSTPTEPFIPTESGIEPTMPLTVVVTSTSTTSIGMNGYDFVANMCLATWSSGAGQLPCPGKDGDAKGFVLNVSNPKLETGSTYNRPGILTFPQNVNNGYIQGFFPSYNVKSGDRFRSIVNCEYNATSCYVVFRLDYQIGTSSIQTFWAFVERYEGQPYQVDLDLSSLVGKDVKFILTVLSTGSPTGDRAMWVAPMILSP
jgi:hypothetical protein